MRDDVFFLKEIICQCDKIRSRIDAFGGNEEDFASNEVFQTSCAFHIIQIGESVNMLSSELKSKYPDVDWKGITGYRNIIVHNYGGVRMESLWVSVIKEVPELKEVCEQILNDQ